jgi:lysophospholipase
MSQNLHQRFGRPASFGFAGTFRFVIDIDINNGVAAANGFSMRTARFLSVLIGAAMLLAARAEADSRPAAKQAKIEDYAVSLLKQPRFQPPEGWTWGYLTNADKARLRYGSCAAAGTLKGTVVLLPGFQSPAEEFFETARDFQALGYNVWILDWRGQGGSDRWLADREKTYSLGFDRDERDLVQFVTKTVHRSGPLFLVGESYGGHMGLRLLHDYPNLIAAAAFSSPAIAFQTGNQSPWLVRMSAWLAVELGYGERYAIKQTGWSFDKTAGGPQDPDSDDRDRALVAQAWPLTKPVLRQGGATWGYVDAFYRSSDLEQQSGWMAQITTPVLIGEVPGDLIAVAPLMASSCAAMKHCTLFVSAHTKHAIFGDRDRVRAPFVAAIAKFFAAHSE